MVILILFFTVVLLSYSNNLLSYSSNLCVLSFLSSQLAYILNYYTLSSPYDVVDLLECFCYLDSILSILQVIILYFLTMLQSLSMILQSLFMILQSLSMKLLYSTLAFNFLYYYT